MPAPAVDPSAEPPSEPTFAVPPVPAPARLRWGWFAAALGFLAPLVLAAASIARTERFTYTLDFPFLEPLPFAAMSGFTPWQLSDHLARFLLLTPAVACLAWALAPVLARARLRVPPLWAVATGGALWVALLAAAVFRGIPVQDDEPTYLMQAANFARGHLFGPAVQHPWAEPFTVFTTHGTTGKYLFGEPLALAPGVWLGYPLLGHLLLVAGTIALVAWAARAAAVRSVAVGAALLLALSPELAFTSATPLSQVPALFGVALAVWGLERPSFRGGAWIGLGLGIAMVSRPQMMLPAALALLLCRRWDLRRLCGALLVGLPFFAAILLYDRAFTGHALKLPWNLYDHERFGFGDATGFGYQFTPWKAVLHTAVVWIRLNGWALGWPLSWLGPLAWAWQRFPRHRMVVPWLAVTIATFVCQFFYFTPGTSETGALYHYAALPFFATSTAAAVESLLRSRHRALTLGALASLFLVGTLSFDVDHALRLRRLTDAIIAPYRDALQLKHDLVLVDLAEDAPYAGLLLGVPMRYRFADEPAVLFPYSSEKSALEIRARFADRHCHFLFWDSAVRRWRFESCDRAKEIAPPMRPQQGPADSVAPPDALLPGPEWRPAFAWLFHPLAETRAVLGR